MSVRSKIIEKALSFPEGTLFPTRAMLFFGSRSAVDNAMCRLVADETFERVAYGLFRLSAAFMQKVLPELTLLEVGEAKALAFKRKPQSVLMDDEAPLTAEVRASIPIVGKTSRFRRLVGPSSKPIYIELKGIAHRKAELSQHAQGKALLKLWQGGEGAFIRTLKTLKLDVLMSEELSSILPMWMNNVLLLKMAV